MKFTVTYYDDDTNSYVTKNCVSMEYGYTDKDFTFLPVDDPPKMYKSLTIKSPQISVYQNERGIEFRIKGFQYNTKNSGYEHTTTVIKSIDTE